MEQERKTKVAVDAARLAEVLDQLQAAQLDAVWTELRSLNERTAELEEYIYELREDLGQERIDRQKAMQHLNERTERFV